MYDVVDAECHNSNSGMRAANYERIVKQSRGDKNMVIHYEDYFVLT